MNFIIGVIFSNFLESEKNARHKYLNNDQFLWVEMQKKILKEKPLEHILPQGKLNQYIYQIIKHKVFNLIIYFSLFLNALYLSIYYHSSSREYKVILSSIAYFLTMIYFIETNLQILAYGIRGYLLFKNGFLKLAITICYTIETLLALTNINLENEWSDNKILNFFSIFHVLVMIRLFKKFKKLKRLIKSLLFSSKHLFSTIVLMILIFFIYAILGCYLFGKVSTGVVLNEYINFNNFFNAMATLFTCSTQDNWTQIMIDCSNVCINQDIEKNCGSSWATIYFFSFMFLVSHILLNVIILVLMQAFEEFYLNPDQPLKFYGEYVKKFNIFWSNHCLDGFCNYMDERKIISFFRNLGSPLGFSFG